ncbi:hypothetical protein EUX98_g1990 [Antrodiella citrinella]|uniref:ferric-chelate reductase (NADPH) n=1 Tax=Antrodiella citrinella TaxID=2447956 RepID=A0A4S4N345_9APHY|nr:hypothetical protein EUX98_g1990 [Antrodiella citrinella]
MHSGKPAVDPAKLVFWVDVLLLGVLGLFTLLRSPWRLRCFANGGEWKRGYMLYHVDTRADAIRSSPSDNTTAAGTSCRSYARPSSDFTHKLVYLSRTPIVSGYSLGRIVLMLLYFGVLLFAALFRDSVFTNPVRDAWIAVSQLPFVVALATKNNVFSVLLGVGHEKLNYLHRYSGRLLVLAANVHAIGFIYQWTLRGIWTQRLQQAEFRWGVVALVNADILFFFSLRIFRQLWYNLFIFTHLIALATLIIAISFHQPAAHPYIIIAAGLYIGDRILRVLKSHLPTAQIECIPDLGTTIVRVPQLNAGWRAGQHVRIRIFSTKMGWFGWTEVHPYTIAAAALERETYAGGEGLTLLVKKSGDWSRKLYAIAEGGKYDSWPDRSSKVRVHIEGPYGGPGNTMFSCFSGGLFFVGGSGITFALGAVREMLECAAERAARNADGDCGMRTIEIVWSVQHARSITPLLPLFTSLLQASGSAASNEDRPSGTSTPSSMSRRAKPTLKISVYYTRAITHLDAQALQIKDGSPLRGPEKMYNSHLDERHATKRADGCHVEHSNGDIHGGPLSGFPPGLSVHASRPQTPRVLSTFLDRTIETLPEYACDDEEQATRRSSGTGVVVGVCGPTALADDARRAIRNVDGRKRKSVGGIELVEE